MMKSLYVLIFVSCSIQLVNAQQSPIIKFKNTAWFIDNKDSAFFKKDTIRLIQYSNIAPQDAWNQHISGKRMWMEKTYDEAESDYLGHGERIQLKFTRNKKMHFIIIQNNYHGFFFSGTVWKYNQKTKVLNLYIGDHLITSMTVLVEKKINIPSNYEEGKSLQTMEILAVKNK